MKNSWIIVAVVLVLGGPTVAEADGDRITKLVGQGQTLWRKSCPGPYLAACVKKTPTLGRKGAKKGGPRCSAGTALRVKRRGRTASAAQKLFARALADYHKINASRRTPRVREAAAAARFHQAEVLFESFIKVQFPAKLDFSSRARKAHKAFAAAIGAKSKLLRDARQAYQDTIRLESARWAVASMARTGQMFKHFADELYQAPIPRPPRVKSMNTKKTRQEFVNMFQDTYCDTLEDKAGPLVRKALQAFEVCVEKARELSVSCDWSSYCADQLKKIRPLVNKKP